jgi:hypothetical protein
MLTFFQNAMPAWTFSSSGHADPANSAAGARNFERGLDSLPKPDTLEYRIGAETIGQFTDALDRLIATFTHDLRSAKFLAERNPFRMTTEQDDPFRTQAARRDDGAEADGTVADDRNRPAGTNLCGKSGVMAGRHHIGKRQQRRQ